MMKSAVRLSFRPLENFKKRNLFREKARKRYNLSRLVLLRRSLADLTRELTQGRRRQRREGYRTIGLRTVPTDSKIAMHLQDNMLLVENSKRLVKVMELLTEANVKGKEMNEVLAMKMHYLGFALKKCARWHDGLEGKDGIEGFIKYLAKGRSTDGFFINEEELIRQAIKEFDYHECTIFKQLVQTIAPKEKGRDPTALAVLTQSINGLRCADFSDCCSVCTEKRNVKKCSACKMVGYCSVRCQKLHWPTHKKFCKELAKEYERQLAAKLEEEKLEEIDKSRDEETNQINGEQKEAREFTENNKTATHQNDVMRV